VTAFVTEVDAWVTAVLLLAALLTGSAVRRRGGCSVARATSEGPQS
jgi:hypothetical protein